MTLAITHPLAALALRPEVSILLKVTLALLLGLAALRLFSRARASVRHLCAVLTLAALVIIPLVEWIGPVIPVELALDRPEAIGAGDARPAFSLPAAAVSAGREAVVFAGSTVPTVSSWSVADGLGALWLAGVAVCLFALGLDLARLRRIRREGVPSLELRGLAHETAARIGVRRPVDVLVHEGIPSPLACGLRRSAIVLPADASSWDEDDIRRAFFHEMEHVRRADWPLQILSRVVCALYWFHPLVWTVWRSVRLEAERACDDAALQSAEPADYAAQLVSLARRQSSAPAGALLGMANRSDLAARVDALLDAAQRRGRADLRVSACAVACAMVLIASIAPIRGVAQRSNGQTPSPFGEALYEAAFKGDLDLIDDLLSRGADPNAVIRGDGTPLIGAARRGHIDAVGRLLDRGADPNIPVSGDGSPLIVASAGGHAEVASLLLDRGADPNLGVEGDGNPLIMAAREGHLGIVQTLLQRGARLEEVVPSDENALISASAAGELEVVRFLVGQGADVNARVWAPRGRGDGTVLEGEWRTALNMAQRFGHEQVVALLRASGVRE